MMLVPGACGRGVRAMVDDTTSGTSGTELTELGVFQIDGYECGGGGRPGPRPGLRRPVQAGPPGRALEQPHSGRYVNRDYHKMYVFCGNAYFGGLQSSKFQHV